MIEEGVHVSSKFLKNDKKLSSAGKKMAALNFQLHRILKKLIEDHINTKNILERHFQLAEVWAKWPARKSVVSRFHDFKTIKNYSLKTSLKYLYGHVTEFM